MTVRSFSTSGRKQSDRHLLKTLGTLGISRRLIEGRYWEVMSSADARYSEMSETYARLNRDLLELAETSPFPISHITGEARVLVDPAHRTVMAECAANGSGYSTAIACKQAAAPHTRIVDAYSFLLAQKDRWYRISRQDLLDILGLCAQGTVGISVLAKAAPVHYSTYGSDRILVQAPHEHPAERKRIWYLRSEELVRDLSVKTQDYFSTAARIPPSSFDGLVTWLFNQDIEAAIAGDDAAWSRLGVQERQRLIGLGLVGAAGQEQSEVKSSMASTVKELREALTHA